MIQIESGIPILKHHTGRTAEIRDALRKIKVGQSFKFSPDIAHHYTMVYRIAKGLGIKVTVRKINGDGLRVWRIKL